MKKRRLMTITFILTFLIGVLFPINVFAGYDEENYEVYDDTWIVTNYHGCPHSIVLTYVAQPSYDVNMAKWPFDFTCLNGEFSTGETFASMEYMCTLDKKIVDKIECGNIRTEVFGVEDGTYNFVGTGYNPIVVPLDYKTNPLKADPDLESKYTYTFTPDMTKDKTLHIYAMIGDYDWAKENYRSFYEYAISKEQKYSNLAYETVVTDLEEEDINPPVETAVIDEYKYDRDNKHIHRYTDENGSVIEITENCTYNDEGICSKCKNQKALSLEGKTIKEETDHFKTILSTVLFSGILIAVLIGLKYIKDQK